MPGGVDSHEYIDYVCSWEPSIAGHAHPAVVERLGQAVERGTSYGAPTEAETELARLVVDTVPSIDLVRFVNSGTEATPLPKQSPCLTTRSSRYGRRSHQSAKKSPR